MTDEKGDQSPDALSIISLVTDACTSFIEQDYEEAEGHFKELILVAGHFCQLSKERQ